MGDKNFSNTTPAAVSGLNVTWQQDGSGNLSAYTSIFGPSGTSHAPGLVPDPGSTSGSTHYLREDGNWEIPSTGSGAFPAGANICPFPPLAANTNGWGGYSLILKVLGTFVQAFTSKFAVTFAIQGSSVYNGATYNTIINKAVIRRTALQSLTWIDSTAITWSGSGSPIFTPGSANAPQFYQSDAITLAMDTAHDYYVIIYIDPTTNVNAFLPYSGTDAIFSTSIGGYLSGDKTATTDASTFSSLTGDLTGISQFLTA